MTSAAYCGHANESPQYERVGNKLVCACPEDCYCKHEGGCRELRGALFNGTSVIRASEHLLYFDGHLVASCTSKEAAEAARRLLLS